ncbi:hypothetical protein [Paenibacillus wulumuqiensis]|uniref:hypothetical protein n=1 Tax=Paenibacillus wulumuqiensis TaxID=1567107 RepID=UPI000619DC52|nr:hypothetical protein [Paenibacillus wulumuqiensis]
MRLNKSGFFSLTLLLAIWIVLVILFGLFTHFSLAGLCLLAQTACILLHNEIQIRYPEKWTTRLLLDCLALGITGVGLFNAWYLEDIGAWFKIYVFLSSLVVAYVCIKMLRETIRQHSAR